MLTAHNDDSSANFNRPTNELTTDDSYDLNVNNSAVNSTQDSDSMDIEDTSTGNLALEKYFCQMS